MGRLRRGVSLLVILVAASLSGRAAGDELRGVALVIGAADYEQLGDLTNTLNDARAMDEMLGDLGFDVTRVLDRDGNRLRREIEDFIADAEGADVALVYYAGHAVEAAGQNFLVPIDADISTPQLAGQSLVAMSDLLDELARTVPVTIMLLDACRSEAFPDGAAILLPGSDAPVPLAANGLSEMRGPMPVAAANVAPESLGMVIGFASAPGQPALDGEPGGNSPYATALLKHLAAGGYAFGDLMTLVTEEVYLKTGARQIPWMNSSLRRVLSFGAPIEASGDDQSLIRDGRRQLLLSIAAMPGDVRRQVEVAASEAAVPMDALYGLLDALGAEAPADPAQLDQLLKKQTETVRALMDERQALSSTDTEIMRLASLAQQAFDEGALEVSIGFWEDAKARYAALSASLDVTEELLKARRLEGGELLARTATAYGLSGDFAASAENFRLAFAEVERWDDARALTYKTAEADATYELGVRKGENDALRQAGELYREALPLTAPGSAPWGNLQRNIGNTYGQLGIRDASQASLDVAIEAFNAALTAFPRDTAPREWAMTQTRLATVLAVQSERESGTETIGATIDAYHAALEVLSPVDDPAEWSLTQNNLGNSLRTLAERSAGSQHYLAAIDAFRAALSVQTPESNAYDWATSQNNLGAVQVQLGIREGDNSHLLRGIDALRLALTVLPRDRVPLQWARAHGNIGAALMWIGTTDPDSARLEESVVSYRAALEEFTPDRSLIDWATATTNLGNALTHLGNRGDRDNLVAGAEAYREVIARLPRDEAPLPWSQALNNLGSTLNLLGERDNDPAVFAEARSVLELALETRTRERAPLDWAMSQENLGNVLTNIGLRESTGNAALLEAAEAYRSAALEYTRERSPGRWAELMRKIGNNLLDAGIREESGLEHFQAALDAYDQALTVFTLEADPLAWVTTANSSGWALAQAAYVTSNLEAMRQARATIQSAWDTVRAQGQTEHDPYFIERLGLIDEVLAAAPAP